MLTLFTIPKPFRGHIGIIQENAIRSWTLLRPPCQVLLFGEDEGTAEVAARFGCRHVPAVARNEYGTPLVNYTFSEAEDAAANELLCFINADIIIMNDLLRAVSRVQRKQFLMLGQRWDFDISQRWNFENPGWEAKLRADVRAHGFLHPYTGVDYYVFPKRMWGEIPAFAVGRTSYDNWLIWRARSLRVPVIDATAVVTCVHQNHVRTYASLGLTSPDKTDDLTSGIEARRNLELAGGRRHRFTLRNADWVLTSRWLLPAWTPTRLWAGVQAFLRPLLPSPRRSRALKTPAPRNATDIPGRRNLIV